MVKNLPVMQEIRVQSLGQEDPLEKGMAGHSSILAWRIPWTEEPVRLQSETPVRCFKELDMTERLKHQLFLCVCVCVCVCVHVSQSVVSGS